MNTTMSLCDTGENSIFSEISQAETVDELKAIVKKLEAIKTILRNMNMFHSQSVKYARLEMMAAIKLVQLGGAKHLYGRKRKAAEWLAEMPESERDKYYEMCDGGLTIIDVWYREYKEKADREHSQEMFEHIAEEMLRDYSKNGFVNLEKYKEKVGYYAKTDFIANSVVDGYRKKLQEAGAIGNADGLYFDRNSNAAERSDDFKLAIKQRIGGIKKDIESLVHIVVLSKTKINLDEIERDMFFNTKANSSDFDLMYLLSRQDIVDEIGTKKLEETNKYWLSLEV